MDKEILEVILKKLARESRIASIIDVETVPALPKGENYSSTILRMTAKVVLGNGRLSKKSFVVKQLINFGVGGEIIKSHGITRIETQVYSVLHKEMSYLMEEFGDTDETLWCKLIHYDLDLSYIVLEDLKTSGYSLVPRQQGLDLEHSQLALNGLGRYHAMTKVLEERGIISKEHYKMNPLFTDIKLLKCFSYAAVVNVAKCILDSWEPSWKETAKKLMVAFEPFAEKWRSMGRYSETEFATLNHGDCWSNNMMFKYNFQKRPIAVKFLDYQLPHYNSPCMDVTNFFYLSIQPEIRRTNYELLVKTYHDSLVTTLDKFGYSGKRPTLEEISATMKRLEFYGLTQFVALYSCVVCSSTEAFDLETLMQTDGEKGYNTEILKEPGMAEKMGPDLINYVERHISFLPAITNNS